MTATQCLHGAHAKFRLGETLREKQGVGRRDYLTK